MGYKITFLKLSLSIFSFFLGLSQDALPMVSNLTFDNRFKFVFEHVFGKTLICRSMEIASQFSRTQNLDCVTLEGRSSLESFLSLSLVCEINVTVWIASIYTKYVTVHDKPGVKSHIVSSCYR